MGDTPLVPNAADRDLVKRAHRKQKDARQARINLLAAVLATPEGRQFVWDELERHGIHNRVSGDMGDLVAVGVFLGRRDAGLELLTEIMHTAALSPAYLLMQREALERAQREELANQAALMDRTGGQD